jgi:hypothetical protein
MNDDKHDSLGPIEYVSEATESTNEHHYSEQPAEYVPVVKEQTALSIFGLILALPFPIFTLVLWSTLHALEGQGQAFGQGAMNAVVLYLLQFFVVPLLSLASIIIAFVVTIKSQAIAKKIGYVSLAITGVGLVILGNFLNHS